MNENTHYSQPEIVKEESSEKDDLYEDKTISDEKNVPVKQQCFEQVFVKNSASPPNTKNEVNVPKTEHIICEPDYGIEHIWIANKEGNNSSITEDGGPKSLYEESSENPKRKHKCQLCGKSFPNPAHVLAHMRVHTGERPYACGTCGKRFSQASHLRTHQGTHTGERRFRCSVCAKAFNQSNALHRHARTHTGEKPYKCPTCDKTFSQLGNLKIHQVVHTGEKPYECDMCNKRFTQSSDLKRHKEKHQSQIDKLIPTNSSLEPS